MPKHHSYLEPFFGSGAVLFNKPISRIETINDLDCDVVNLFKCIRDNCEELAKVTATTPFSREEYEKAYIKNEEENEIEKARKFLIRCWMSFGSRIITKGGWRHDVHGREAAYSLKQWYDLPMWIINYTERLRQVQIENRLAVEIMANYNNEKVLIYADPPYLISTRTGGKQYVHEMEDKDHEIFLQAALNHKGAMIISGYESDMYNETLEGWFKNSIANTAELGIKRTDVIWANYPASQQLSFF